MEPEIQLYNLLGIHCAHGAYKRRLMDILKEYD
jgi:hypothetical protein